MKLNVEIGVNIILTVFLLLFLIYQTFGQRATGDIESNGYERFRHKPIDFSKYTHEEYSPNDFNKTLPFETEEYNEEEAKQAETFLHLPKWSKQYRSCKEHPEISCFELIRAKNVIKGYLETVKQEQTTGFVKVNLITSPLFHCRISSIYAGFIVSMVTKRRLVIITDDNLPYLHESLRKVFSPPSYFPNQITFELPNNFSFSCFDLNTTEPVLELNACTWPQMSYIHPVMGPWLRESFGIHGAYYIGNFLFGVFNGINGCAETQGQFMAVKYKGLNWSIKEKKLLERGQKCFNSLTPTVYEEKEIESSDKQLCLMKQIIVADNVVFPFGSTTSWFAMAMKGKAESVVELDGKSCFKLRNSQSGSVYHIYNPRKKYHYSINNDFYVCGENLNDARMYERYLMW